MKRRKFLGASLAAGFCRRAGADEVPPEFLRPGAAGYEQARQPFNTCVALRPSFIAPCRTELDVTRAVRFARARSLPVAVKSGGHSFTGFSLNEGGLALDLSGLRTSVLESASHRYTAGPGLRLGEVYDWLLPHGRLLPAGSCSGVGLAGLTLSGGYYSGFASLANSTDTIARAVQDNPGLIFQVNTLGGAIGGGDESAYPHRDYPYLGEIQSYWEADSRRERLTKAVIALRHHLTEEGVSAHYRNYPDLSLANCDEAYYGPSYAKLQNLKARYDPNDLFQHPQSVRLPSPK